MSKELDHIRKRLDEVDQRIVDALAERFDLVGEVARFKVSGAGNLRDPLREEEVLTRLVTHGKEAGLDGFFVTQLFREILDHSLRRQQKYLLDHGTPPDTAKRICFVAYQGAEGAYSHIAAARHFSAATADTVLRGYDTFHEIGEAVQDGSVQYGVLPIENTTAGSINEVYDLLARHSLSIVGEEIQTVDHCLVALDDVPLSSIRRIRSHPQALAQCSRFLATLSNCRAEAFTDTAMAVKQIREEGDPSQAAIASEEAATLYGLRIVKRHIANQRANYTRFVIVAAKPVVYDVRVPCKTSILFAVRHEKGTLSACLDNLARRNLNLTKLESRPRPHTPFEYLFYVDFEGNVADDNVSNALREVAAHTNYLKVFGSYPTRTTTDAKPATPRRVALASRPSRVEKNGGELDPALRTVLEGKPYKLAARTTRSEDTRIVVGEVTVGGEHPVVIAGPCAVESRDQIMRCAQAVKDLGGDILRGGCFKPRTSPYSFQGLGFEGLELLHEAGHTYGLPVVTEVLHPSDVEAVARRADILQVGARNMQNFALLKEVGRTHRPVILKRGMMSAIDEWLSAAEYILAQGNQQVILCERGIRTFETATRNTLDLAAVPVVRERTHLPVIVDPSHACGTWRWVPKMAEAALAAGAQGVMVEIHPDPERALSDGPQALRLATFGEMMHAICARSP